MEMSHESAPEFPTGTTTIKVDVAKKALQSGEDFGAKVSRWSLARLRFLRFFPRSTTFWR